MEIRNLRGDLLFNKQGDKLDICELDGVNLAQAALSGFDFQMIMLDGNNLAGADLSGAMLYWCVLVDVNLEGANLEGANLQGTSLSYINFRRANLKNADLGLSNLDSPTTIKNSDFTDAILDGTIFSGAWYNHESKFPEGFNPSVHGMILKTL